METMTIYETLQLIVIISIIAEIINISMLITLFIKIIKNNK